MEVAAEVAVDDTWQRIVVTILTVVAFGLASGGLFHAFLSMQQATRRAERQRTLRAEFRDRHHSEKEEINGRTDLSTDKRNALLREASDRWRGWHVEAGIEPWTYQASNDAREFLAEGLIHDLSEGTRSDLWIAGAGLVLGLIASVWGTWLP